MLDETCQYLYERDMYFIIFTDNPRRLPLIADIEKMYPDHFLGIYFDDEQGGRQLDLYKYRWVMEAENYTDAANQFIEGLNWWLNLEDIRNETLTYSASDFTVFTSDYCLYWYCHLHFTVI